MTCSFYLGWGAITLGQNLIQNNRFDCISQLPFNGDMQGSNSDIDEQEALDSYWNHVVFWQPPLYSGPNLLGHVGSADISENYYYSSPTAAFLGGKEFLVGEIEPTLPIGEHLYYYQSYIKSQEQYSDGTINISLCFNRPSQFSSSSDISFNGGFIRFTPEINHFAEPDQWYKVAHLFDNAAPFDRIAIGSLKPGQDDASVAAGGYYIDDLKLINLGPGGLCPDTRGIQNITYTDEEIMYRASETIVAGTDVATYTTLGPVTVTGSSDITYRAGHEIQLLDGFGVEAGGTFHAFIAPCECDPPIANAGEPIEICDVITAHGIVQLGGEPQPDIIYQWSCFPEDGLAFISDPTASNPQFTPQLSGSYTFTVTATNVCQEVSTDDVVVAYILNADDSPSLNVDFTLSETTFLATLTIFPDPSAYEIVVQDWIADGSILGDEWPLIVSQDFQSGQPFDFIVPTFINGCDGHRIKVKLRNICSSEWVTVQEYFPQTQDTPAYTLTTNVISPNGDGINDQMCFSVSSGLAYDVLIFDRDGLLVYSSSDLITSVPVCTWDGTCNETCTGEYLTAGTYYQLIMVMGCDENPVAYGGDIFLTNSPSGRVADPNLPILERNSELKPSFFSPKELPALHPNPTTGLITYTGTDAVSSYQIMDLQGRTLHSVSLSGSYSPPGMEGPGEVNLAPASTQGPIQIDLSPYRPGTYLLRVQHLTGTTEVHRIIRQ